MFLFYRFHYIVVEEQCAKRNVDLLPPWMRVPLIEPGVPQHVKEVPGFYGI